MNYELSMATLKKIQEYIFYLFIFLLPWQTRWIIRDAQINGGVFEYGRISLYAFDVVFILLFLAVVILRKDPPAGGDDEGSRTIQKNPFFIFHFSFFIFLILISYLLSLFFAPDKLLTTYWYLRIVESLLLFYLIKKINFSKTKTAVAFIFSITISSMLGIYQFITQTVFASKWLGISSQNPSDLGVSVIETTTERFLRAYGNMPHPNILAGFIVIAIILCFWLIMKQNKTTKKLLLYYFITLLLITGLFFTFSRAAWLVFFIFLAYVILRRSSNDDEESRRAVFRYIIISLLLFSCLLFIYLPLIKTRVSNTSRLETKSNTERINGYGDAWQIIKQNPLTGVGLGNYTLALQKLKPNQPAYFYQPVHNVYLLALAELGIPVFIAFITLLLYYFITRLQKPFFLFSCFFFFIFFLTDHFFWTLPSAFLLVFVLWITFSKNDSQKKLDGG
jgi:O-antigen ligase